LTDDTTTDAVPPVTGCPASNVSVSRLVLLHGNLKGGTGDDPLPPPFLPVVD
jgi:hypothetical protein